MHKIIKIPYSPAKLLLYVGEDGFIKLKKDMSRINKGVIFEKESVNGLQYTCHIYVKDVNNKTTLMHEAIHFLDWLYKYLDIIDEPEFKACVGSYVINQLLNIKEAIE